VECHHSSFLQKEEIENLVKGFIMLEVHSANNSLKKFISIFIVEVP
jgi:hypothetical protein